MTAEVRSAIVVFLILVSAGCRKERAPENRSEPASQQRGQPTNVAAPSGPTPEKPSLSCQVENVSLYPVPNNPDNLAISIIVVVRNSGAPSTAQDWKLTVQLPNRTDLDSLDAVHVNGVVEMPGAAATHVDLAKEDLVLKTKEFPIAKSAQVKGVLTFIIPKTSLADVSNNQSNFVIHFKDSQDGLYRSRKTVIGAKRL